MWLYHILLNPNSCVGGSPCSLYQHINMTVLMETPETDLRRAKEYGRVYVLWTGRRPVINITDADMVRDICVKNFPNFMNKLGDLPLSPIQKSMIVFLENDRWKFVRSILSPGFSSGKLRQMVPLLEICIKRMVENLEEFAQKDEPFNVNSIMGGLTMEVIASVGFGIQTDVQKGLNDQFQTLANSAFKGTSASKLVVVVAALFPFMKSTLEFLGLTTESKEFTTFCVQMLKEAIKGRRLSATNRKDLLQLLLDSSLDDLKETFPDGDVNIDALKTDNIKENRNLSDLEIIAQTILFLFAGFDTTASALAYLSYNLAVYPDCQEKLINEIDEALDGAAPTYDNVMSLPYLDQCLSETQRLYPATRRLSRISAGDVTVNGIQIPANTRVAINVYAIQHDEKYWAEPEKFDPERWSRCQKADHHPHGFITFGAGPRSCVGMRLALMEIKMAVVTILQKFRFIRVPETEVPLTLKQSVFVQPEKGIFLKIEARS